MCEFLVSEMFKLEACLLPQAHLDQFLKLGLVDFATLCFDYVVDFLDLFPSSFLDLCLSRPDFSGIHGDHHCGGRPDHPVVVALPLAKKGSNGEGDHHAEVTPLSAHAQDTKKITRTA